MQTLTLADQVREYVTFTREIYESREWMNVRAALARLVQNCDELTTKDVRHALDCLQLEHQISPSYRRSCWTRWRRFLRWAVEHELASAELLVHVQAWRPRFSRPRSPVESLTPPRREPPLTFVHIRDALLKLPKLSRDVVQLLTLTGARPSELLSLRTLDVDLDRRRAVVNQHKNAHRDIDRELCFPIPAIRLLEERLTPFTPADWIFPAPTDVTRNVTPQTVAQQLRRTFRRHNQLRPFVLYDLRRLAARTIRAHASLDHAQALGLFAVLIAESWPEGNAWVARIGWPVLERRLNASKRSLKRWADELDQLDLVQRIPGDGRELTQWGIWRRGRTDATPEGAPTRSGGRTDAPPEGAPTRPVSGLSQDITQEPADDANVPKRARVVDAATKAQRVRELRAQLALANASGSTS